mgnify:CR=1 FL=1|jgi:hypothetical protein
MPFVDLIIWYLAIYGMAWSIVHAKPLTFLREWVGEKYIKENKLKWLYELSNCIVCVSFWCAAVFVNHYFNSETFITRVLIVFSNVAFTWFMANRFRDIDEEMY